MATIDDITKLAECSSFTAYCRSIAHGNDKYKDLINHVILILFEKSENELALILNVHNFARGIAYKQYYSKGSEFNKLFGKEEAFGSEALFKNIQEDEKEITEERHSVVSNIMDVMAVRESSLPVHYYIFKEYVNCKTIRATAKKLNIPKSTVHDYISIYRNKIKSKENEITYK